MYSVFSVSPSLDVTVEAEAGTTEVYDVLVSTLQSNVSVKDKEITGTLKFVEGGLAQSGPLAGDGNFLALKFSSIPADATSVKVGLTNSQGTGLVELLGDPDMNAVGKIADKDLQKFRVEVTRPSGMVAKEWDLSNLVCETE